MIASNLKMAHLFVLKWSVLGSVYVGSHVTYFVTAILVTAVLATKPQKLSEPPCNQIRTEWYLLLYITGSCMIYQSIESIKRT